MIKTLIFDLDDTLYDTSSELRRILLEDYGFKAPPGLWLCDQNTNGLMSKIHENPTFMSTAKLFDTVLELPDLILQFRALGGRVAIATHRGFHWNAQALSRVAFERDGLEFDEELFLCPTEQRCKITYLNDCYGAGNYWLFDDNPKGGTQAAIHELYVHLIDRPHNQHIQSTRRLTTSDMVKRVRALVEYFIP